MLLVEATEAAYAQERKLGKKERKTVRRISERTAVLKRARDHHGQGVVPDITPSSKAPICDCSLDSGGKQSFEGIRTTA